jgi:hypothetical protein
MYFHNVVGTGSYTTSTTNMYNKDRFHSPRASFFLLSVLVEQSGVRDVVVGMGVHQRGMVHVPVPHVQHHRHLWGGDE